MKLRVKNIDTGVGFRHIRFTKRHAAYIGKILGFNKIKFYAGKKFYLYFPKYIKSSAYSGPIYLCFMEDWLEPIDDPPEKPIKIVQMCVAEETEKFAQTIIALDEQGRLWGLPAGGEWARIKDLPKE